MKCKKLMIKIKYYLQKKRLNITSTLLADNKSTKSLAKNLIAHARSKHIEIKLHFHYEYRKERFKEFRELLNAVSLKSFN
jgi:hypothetical protein